MVRFDSPPSLALPMAAAMDNERDLPEAAFQALIDAAGDNVPALLRLAEVAGQRNNYRCAAELAGRARILWPDDPETAFVAADIISRTVPEFHLPMMHDVARNAAFADAIARQVQPDMRVLDIGSGSGLLAMMAARAGAGEVWSCEAQPAVAAVARDIVRRNGYADRVNILSKHSRDIDAAADMGGPADLIVAEVIASDVVSEHVLPTMRDAVRRLARPGARLIPQAAEIRVALAWWDKLDRRYIGEVDGFDLTPFNRLVQPHFYVPVHSKSLSLRGPAATLFHFDFAAPDQARDRNEVMLEGDGRPANGVIQWLHLQLDEEGAYENRPDSGGKSSWDATFHPLPAALTPATGSGVRLAATYRGDRLKMWTAAETVPSA